MMTVPYSHLAYPQRQTETEAILTDIRKVVEAGDFTLGRAVGELEEAWAAYCGTQHAVAVANGTDALALSLMAYGIGRGDTVMTTPYTFVATVGAILQAGARPAFADIGADGLINLPSDRQYLDSSVTGLMPVCWAGAPWIVPPLFHRRPDTLRAIVLDACQAIGATPSPGAIVGATAYSLHPLKNLHVWGDGGMITTDLDWLADRLRLLRNHGLSDRDTWAQAGYNSRLDTIQAVVALHGLRTLDGVLAQRRANAARYDRNLAGCSGVTIPRRHPGHTYHLYQVLVRDRTGLLVHLAAAGIEAKVHYPVPLHLQPALAYLGYKRGHFPHAEHWADTAITLPVHQYLSDSDIDYVSDQVRSFYGI